MNALAPDETNTSTSITLRDPTACLFVLARLIASMEEHDDRQFEELAAAGLTAAFAEQLRSLPLTDAVRLARSPHFKVGIVIDWASGAKALKREAALRTEQALFEEFVRKGASTRLLRKLFKATAWRVRTFASVLEGAAPRCRGNVALPDEATREAIGRAWLELETHADPRRRYLAMHEKFPHLSLIAIEKVVQRFGPPGSSTDSPSSPETAP